MVMKWWGWGAEDKQIDLTTMPKFLPYIETIIGCNTHLDQKPVNLDDISLMPSQIPLLFMDDLLRHFKTEQVLSNKLERLRHTYGKSFRDLFRIRRGIISRAPDLVIYPEHSLQVAILLKLAAQYNIKVIPFGGGTNIVGAIEASADDDIPIIVSLDLTRMHQVLAIDVNARTATIQSGILGPDLETHLNTQGFTLGHFPDSFQFSTLGGWLATRSAGMYSDHYGTISDMVLSMEVVTPKGTILTSPVPHASCGPDILSMLVGSEGSLGVITQATMKIHPLPEASYFGALLFPTFSDGIKAVHQCAIEKQLPHMMRLLDNEETQLGMHLKPQDPRLKALIQLGVRSYLKRFRNIRDDRCACLIIALSGSAQSIREKKRTLLRICRQFGGIFLGSTPGNAWYERKYDYPYLRDVVMSLGGVVDVAETSTVWSKIEATYQSVKAAGYQALAQCTPITLQQSIGRSGYIGCHLSHNYYNGACLYFTFAFTPTAGQELEQYWQVKQAMTQAIVDCGGALSHHHSIGVEHAPWMTDYVGDTAMNMLTSIKQSVDPNGTMN